VDSDEIRSVDLSTIFAFAFWGFELFGRRMVSEHSAAQHKRENMNKPFAAALIGISLLFAVSANAGSCEDGWALKGVCTATLDDGQRR
jgi:hypothetical protein